MPAVSNAQATAMRIAEHAPAKLYKRNRGILGMKKSDLHEFAATKSGKLPEHVARSMSGVKPGKKLSIRNMAAAAA